MIICLKRFATPCRSPARWPRRSTPSGPGQRAARAGRQQSRKRRRELESLRNMVLEFILPSMKRKPIFSRQDSDLRRIKWTYSPFGYPRKGLGYRRQVFAHHIVIERMLGRKRRPDEITDHVNGNPLDVRRENLRITNWDGNGQNRRLGKFRGATFHKQY